MSLTLDELKTKHDKAYNRNQVTRERASDDLVFYWVTQWDDNSLSESQLSYRGEFNLLRKAGRAVMADLAANPVQVDFEPVGETREDAGEVLDGMYRADDNKNYTIESYGNAQQETVVCGVGAWLLYHEYASRLGGDNRQIIKRKPIFEANNVVFWDPNARMLDKSDANYVSVLFAYSEDGYKDLVAELTGEEPEDVNPVNFKNPEISYVFPWIGGEEAKVYVSEFYQREEVEEKILTLENPFGMTTTVSEKSLEVEEDTLLDQGYEIIDEKTIKRYRVTKYIASGEQILNGEEVDGERVGEEIAGENLPVIPVYGEHAHIEGEEHWEGVTRLAKDPQRLRNFQLSYLADIVSRSPREKPIFFPEQVAGFEDDYSLTGSENNLPYLRQHQFNDEGQPFPIGPVAMLPAPNIPPALGVSIDLSRQAMEDVGNTMLPNDIADTDLSGKAFNSIQARLDMQSMVYQENMKHAKRRDAEVYASMASEIMDVPTEVTMEGADGSKKKVKMMETVIDDKGELVTLHNLNNAEFNVYSKIGPSYTSQKEQTLERIDTMMAGLDPNDPMRQILMLKGLVLSDGVDFDDVRDYAKIQLVVLGINKPETPEEEQALAQAQQAGQQESAEMVLSQAEMVKAQAKMKEVEFNYLKLQAEMGNENAKRQIEGFEAQTDRIDTQIDAQEAGAKIENTKSDTFGKNLDNTLKVKAMNEPSAMSDNDIWAELATG